MVPGSEINGRYVLEELLGSGGMGEVWRATDRELERRVAVKVMREQLSSRMRSRDSSARRELLPG